MSGGPIDITNVHVPRDEPIVRWLPRLEAQFAFKSIRFARRFWEGKRGAAVGVFQQVVAKKESVEHLQECVNILRATNNPQIEYMVNRVIKKWCQDNRMPLD